jgi:hypothetical protein
MWTTVHIYPHTVVILITHTYILSYIHTARIHIYPWAEHYCRTRKGIYEYRGKEQDSGKYFRREEEQYSIRYMQYIQYICLYSGRGADPG